VMAVLCSAHITTSRMATSEKPTTAAAAANLARRRSARRRRDEADGGTGPTLRDELCFVKCVLGWRPRAARVVIYSSTVSSAANSGWRAAAKGFVTVTPRHVKPSWRSSERSRRHSASADAASTTESQIVRPCCDARSVALTITDADVARTVYASRQFNTASRAREANGRVSHGRAVGALGISEDNRVQCDLHVASS
jgi:hypothetical protein